MKTRYFGGSFAALLLALALAGCNKGGGTTTPTTVGAISPTSSSDALATVGGTPITRGELTTLLEGIAGTRVLPELIDGQLLTEALKAKKGEVTEDEVTAELARIGESDATVKAAVTAGGPRAQVARQQVRRNLTVQKLLTEGITADDAKVKAFYNKYAAYYGTPLQVRLGILAASTKARADILARAVKSKPASFDTLVAEQKKTNDPLGAQSTGDTGRFQPVEQIFGSNPAIAPLNKGIATAKKGQILPVQALSPQGPFLIVRVVDRQEASKPDFAKFKDQATVDYKLAQAAEIEIKKNPQNPQTLEQNIKAVVEYLARPNQQTGAPGIKASLRDALTSVLIPASQNLLTTLRTNGSVQISDPSYKDIAQAYAPAPAAGAAGNVAAGNTATNGGAPATSGAAPTMGSAPATGSAPARP